RADLAAPFGRTLPFAFAAVFLLPFFAAAATTPARGRSFLPRLVDALGILAAPAALPARRGIEDAADFLHHILRETGVGAERIAPGLLRAFGNPGERVAGQGHDRDRRRALV